MSQIPRGSSSASRTDLKAFRNWKWRTVGEYFIGKRITKKRICCLYPGPEEKTSQLTYCQKFPNLTTRAVRQLGEYDIKREDTINYYYFWHNSKFRAGLGLLWNVGDLDFNRAIFIRPHKHICMWLRLDTVYANTEQRSESHQIGYKMFFSSMDVNECIHKQPPYMRTIILPLSFKICILIISRYISWVFSNILS